MTPPTADRHLLRVLETVRRDLLPLCEAVARMLDDAQADRAHEPRDGS